MRKRTAWALGKRFLVRPKILCVHFRRRKGKPSFAPYSRFIRRNFLTGALAVSGVFSGSGSRGTQRVCWGAQGDGGDASAPPETDPRTTRTGRMAFGGAATMLTWGCEDSGLGSACPRRSRARNPTK